MLSSDMEYSTQQTSIYFDLSKITFTHVGISLGLICVLSYLYFTVLVIYQCYILRKFKGPMPLPIVGNVYEASVFRSWLRHMSNLRKRYGRIFSFIALTKPLLVVCDPIVVRRVLSDPKTFPKGDDYTKYFNIGFGSSLVTSNGEKHKHDRGIFGRFFIKSFVVKFFGAANSLTVESVEEKVKQANGHAISINIEDFFASLALRTFGMFSMGIDYRQDPKREKEICHLVSRGSLAMAQIIGFRLPQWDIVPQIKLVKKVRYEVGLELQKYMKPRLDLIAKGEAPDDCLTAMLTENMTHEEMKDHFMTLLCAGHDTTAFFSAYLSLLLAQHPSCQEKVYEEIKRVIGDRIEVTAEDCAELHYFQKCMQETLRLFAIIPNVSRVSTTDVYVKEANITIPKGVTVLIPMFLINRDPELWENPSDFNPDRFDGKVSADFTSAKNGFFPFGYGSRTCIGNTLAQLESTIFFCHLLRRFRIEQEPGFKPNIMSGISLTTSNGINVILKPR